MILIENGWEIPKDEDEACIEKRLLQRRSISLEEALLWHDPFSFPDMGIACDRVKKALVSKEKILIFGDYDADGISATTLLMLFLRQAGAICEYMIPNRLEDGYGISSSLLSKIKERGASLLITVDCGVASVEEISWLMENQIDVIVTDHHEPKEILPNAIAVLDAKRKDSSYPFSELCGAGVALKLVQALCLSGVLSSETWEEYMDIAAIGTIADIVPLVDENRLIVKQGLQMMNDSPRPAISALLRERKKPEEKITSSGFGYTLIPLINAAGRMGSPDQAVELFLSAHQDEMEKIASLLRKENTLRQETELRIFEEAVSQLEGNLSEENNVYDGSGAYALCGHDWHPGVIGIVASRLVERYRRPFIVFTDVGDEPGLLKGSARSYGEFSILSAILSAEELVEKCGGHQKAAGVSIRADLFSSFLKKIRAYGEKEEMLPVKKADVRIYPSEISLATYTSIQKIEPFGAGNPEPCFFLASCTILEAVQVGNAKHLRLKISCEDEKKEKSYIFSVIYFQGGHLDKLYSKGNEVDLLLFISTSFWKEKEIISLRVRDIRFSKKGKSTENQPELLETLYKNNLPIKQMIPLMKSSWEKLLVSKEDMKGVYRFLSGLLQDEMIYCDFSLLMRYYINTVPQSEASVFSFTRILDIFCESGLIQVYNRNEKRISFRLLPVTQKVKLEDTPTFQKLQSEGGVRE